MLANVCHVCQLKLNSRIEYHARSELSKNRACYGNEFFADISAEKELEQGVAGPVDR
jgi:hypothetical protein